MTANLSGTNPAGANPAGTNPVDELGVDAAFLPWAPEGAGDFADAAWIAAQALGNGAGVRRFEVSVTPAGTVHVYLTAADAEYVRGVAARFGWDARDSGSPDWYLTTGGRVGNLYVSVSWIGERPDESAGAA